MSTSDVNRGSAGFGLPRRFLRPLLLLSLAQVRRSHGYELAEAVRACGLNVDMAGVYRELRALEQRAVLDSGWEPSENGPERRVYELTAEGRVVAATAIAELAVARDLLTAALADHEDLGLGVPELETVALDTAGSSTADERSERG
jgi:DNA-binding PadR family transcriptional regulator